MKYEMVDLKKKLELVVFSHYKHMSPAQMSRVTRNLSYVTAPANLPLWLNCIFFQ